MSAFKGTPGPWYHGSHPMNCDVVYAARYEERVAECNGADEHEAEANARLISAAPELLEALEELMSDVLDIRGVDVEEYKPEGFKRARAAIAKALGEQP